MYIEPINIHTVSICIWLPGWSNVNIHIEQFNMYIERENSTNLDPIYILRKMLDRMDIDSVNIHTVENFGPYVYWMVPYGY